MRQVHKAGEKLFIDFSGATVPIVNPDTGEIYCAEIFVAVLGASSYIQATWSQKKPIGLPPMLTIAIFMVASVSFSYQTT
ncbi:MAG: hypothetical protein P8176_14230 [Gammaproteobacteria bacterium]